MAENCSLAAPCPIAVVVPINANDSPSTKICFFADAAVLFSSKNHTASKTTVRPMRIIQIVPNDVSKTSAAVVCRRIVAITSIKTLDANTAKSAIPVIVENLL